MARISTFVKSFCMCLCLVVASMFVFVGCGSGFPPFEDNPNTNDVVSGNGSFAVTKGNYLYFANGFVEASSITEGVNGNTEYATLYRVKLDENGHVTEKEKQKDEDGNDIFDPAQTILNVDILCKKIVGFETMGLYIFGDYIYFATPNNEKGVVEGELKLRTDLVDICRTKIDRSTGVEKLYTSQNAATDCKYSMVQNGNEVVLIFFDKDKLVIKKIVNNNVQGEKVVAENVTSCALPSYSRSDVALTELDKDVYYTRDVTDSDTVKKGNVLMKVNLSSFVTTPVRADDSTTFTVKQTNGKYLYVEENYTEFGSTYSSIIYAFEDFATDSVRGTKIASNSYTSFIAADANFGPAVIAGDGTNLYFLSPSAKRMIYSGNGTLVKVQNNNVYFIVDENLYCKNYSDTIEAKNLTDGAKAHLPNATYVCINKNKIYYFKDYDNDADHHYMHMIDLDSVDEDGVVYNHFVGVMMPSDYLKEATD